MNDLYRTEPSTRHERKQCAKNIYSLSANISNALWTVPLQLQTALHPAFSRFIGNQGINLPSLTWLLIYWLRQHSDQSWLLGVSWNLKDGSSWHLNEKKQIREAFRFRHCWKGASVSSHCFSVSNRVLKTNWNPMFSQQCHEYKCRLKPNLVAAFTDKSTLILATETTSITLTTTAGRKKSLLLLLSPSSHNY